ncbi:MAG TPA: DUF1778 domain-containing protein [Pirellulales bacterium]|jgi:uncharacterized protein (DUF1778 family)
MSSSKTKQARLNFRLSNDLKAVIEEAAAALGQSVSDYVIATLVRSSQSVLAESSVTVLSHSDRKKFAALLDDSAAKPNRALTVAAKRYKQRFK